MVTKSRKQHLAASTTSPAAMNFRVRVLTTLTLMPIALIGAYVGGVLWALILTPVVIIGYLEFYGLSHKHPYHGHRLTGATASIALFAAFYIALPQLTPLILLLTAVFTFVHERFQKNRDTRRAVLRSLTTLVGLIYVALPLAFLLALRQSEHGFLWLMIVFGGTWGADTFAYFGGRIWGKHKLAPRLSPNKTIEGAITGILGGWVFPFLFLIVADALSPVTFAWVIAIPLVAIVGDLLESGIKRFFQVKDSHLTGLNVMPGHGGVLDRIDALLLVSACSYGWLVLNGLM